MESEFAALPLGVARRVVSLLFQSIVSFLVVRTSPCPFHKQVFTARSWASWAELGSCRRLYGSADAMRQLLFNWYAHSVFASALVALFSERSSTNNIAFPFYFITLLSSVLSQQRTSDATCCRAHGVRLGTGIHLRCLVSSACEGRIPNFEAALGITKVVRRAWQQTLTLGMASSVKKSRGPGVAHVLVRRKQERAVAPRQGLFAGDSKVAARCMVAANRGQERLAHRKQLGHPRPRERRS